jgi:hypothetical protein
MARRYDTQTTTFSPEGRLYQVRPGARARPRRWPVPCAARSRSRSSYNLAP